MRVSGAWLNTLESHHHPDSGLDHSREKRGRAEEERREDRKTMWKGKGEDSAGTRADVQTAVPADSILLPPPPSSPVLV